VIGVDFNDGSAHEDVSKVFLLIQTTFYDADVIASDDHICGTECPQAG